MAALVDYTALTEAEGFKDGFPICSGSPVDGACKEFFRKVRVDFSLTNMASGDWAKIMVIPAHTYVLDVFAVVVVAETAGNILVGDAGTDQTNNWITTTAATSANTLIKTPASTNMATWGKYYHSAGALYLSISAAFNEAIIDVYVKCITIDPA
jgi:hypothetical protein